MKKIFSLLNFVLFSLLVVAQTETKISIDDLFLKKEEAKAIPHISKYLLWGVGYEFATPQGKMNNGMSNAHGISIFGGVPLNFISKNLLATVNLNYGLYGVNTFGINYTQNSNYINTSITYSSSITQAGLGLQYILKPENKLQPYLIAKAGYTYFSSDFTVSDPRDIDACRALENENIISDATYYYGYGLGLRLLLGEPSNKSRDFLNLSFEKINGGEIDYVNVNSLHDHNAPLQTSNGGKPVNITFVNASSQNTHQHKIAEQFTNPFNMLQIKFSYTKYFSIR